LKAIIIGSGIAGLATAIRLAKQGYITQVFEANNFVGGKLSEFKIGDFRFDRGPSLFTLPNLIDELFELCGLNPNKEFPYLKLDESCRYFFDDGKVFKAYHDRQLLSNEIKNVFGVDATQFLKHLERSNSMHHHLSKLFMERSLHMAKNYLNIETAAAIANITKLGLFQVLNNYHEKHINHPQLVQYFNRFATYNGSNPYKAPATLHIIPHLEHGIGAFFPKNGMYQISSSLYQLALKMGVNFKFNTPVKSITCLGKKVMGIQTESGFTSADIVVSNMDVYHTYKKLLPNEKHPENLLNQEKSSSALIFYWGINTSFEQLNLHNIFFSNDYKREFEGVSGEKALYDDPTVYVNITSKYQKSDAPNGMENWFVMINVPHNNGQDWELLVALSRENVIKKLSKILKCDISKHIIEETHWTPPGIEQLTSSYKGALYGNASNNKLAAFLRHRNQSKQFKNLFFCGGSVHPGGGIPLCLLSAKIVADLVKEEFNVQTIKP
jgi:phytoene desaturase